MPWWSRNVEDRPACTGRLSSGPVRAAGRGAVTALPGPPNADCPGPQRRTRPGLPRHALGRPQGPGRTGGSAGCEPARARSGPIQGELADRTGCRGRRQTPRRDCARWMRCRSRPRRGPRRGCYPRGGIRAASHRPHRRQTHRTTPRPPWPPPHQPHRQDHSTRPRPSSLRSTNQDQNASRRWHSRTAAACS